MRSRRRHVPAASATHHSVLWNITAHSRVARDYGDRHPEIFNHVEQERVSRALQRAVGYVSSGGRQALDFGCGDGNLTRHLQNLGFAVTAADVTPAFLRLVAERFGAETLLLPGGDMSGVPEDTYDLITVYSVLHHVPDYLGTVCTLVRKLRAGGVLFIDHERSDSYWAPDEALQSYRHDLSVAGAKGYWDPDRRRWQYLLRAAVLPSRHMARVRKWRGINDEGDIHVYQDDHIQWERVCACLEECGAEAVAREEYLHFAGRVSEAVWARWRDRCADMAYVIARRQGK